MRNGYNFGGWNTNSSGTGTTYPTGFNYTVTENVTLYAKWITYYPPKYTITYSGNGATTGVPDPVTVDSGSTVTLPTMTMSEYNFDGWNTNRFGTGTTYPANYAYTVTNDIILYAKWTAVYTLTTSVSPSGSGKVSCNPSASRYDAGTSVTVTATAASGYTFAYWNWEGWPRSASVTITVNRDITLTANFKVVVVNNCTSASTCKQVTIGGKTWMAENLNITTADSWCYENSADNCVEYGRLYTWSVAKSACSLAGIGWRLPTRADWDSLARAVGGTKAYTSESNNHYWDNAGEALKSTSGWYYNGNGTDKYGFSGLPGGYRQFCGDFGYCETNGGFNVVGSLGYWWTATEYTDGNAYYRTMDDNSDYLLEGYRDKHSALSVRCVKD